MFVKEHGSGNSIWQEAKQLVGREFIHFKGNRYKLLAVATPSETLDSFVVYQALYGDYGVKAEPTPAARAEFRRLP